ncbi:MAG: N-acetyltransferase [Candidatus Thorarchaeota archaeon]
MQISNLNDFNTYPGSVYIHKNADIAEDVEISFGCIIHENVIIREGTRLAENCIIRPNVKIEKNCEIHDNVEIAYNYHKGMQTVIGENSVIRRGSTLYAGNFFGKGFQSGSFTHIRESCTFGEYCSVGTFSQFEGYTNVGKYSRFHTNVHIGQHSEIGQYVWVFPYVIFTNDKYPPHDVCPPYKTHKGPKIEDFAIISTSSVLMPGITIGEDCLIGAGSIVTKNVPNGELWMGIPAKFIKKVKDIKWDDRFIKDFGAERPYPWRFSFKRKGYLIDK